MIEINKTLIYACIFWATLAGAYAQVSIRGNYTQTFDNIGSNLPDGWTVRTGASASALGTTASYTKTVTSPGTTTGAFNNYHSIESGASSGDEVLGIRQSGSFGDAGASFNFNFNTLNTVVSAISIDLQMLSVQPRSTTWTLQYGIGANPTTWTTLGTYTDPGTVGVTTKSFTTANFGTTLNNQANVWFRVVTLTASTGSGNRDSFGINDFTITAVPEPHEYGMAIAALLGAMVFVRRCQKAKRA